MMQKGVRKQALDMQRRLEIDESGLYHAIKQVNKGCSVCQACNPDNQNVQGEAQWTSISDQPMESLALDVCSMPEVHIGHKCISENEYSIVWSCVWTDTVATLWPSRRAKRGC